MGAALLSVTQYVSSFCSAVFQFFSLFPKTADPGKDNLFKSKEMAFAMTVLSKKFNCMLILFCP